jgi:hypothetical protein
LFDPQRDRVGQTARPVGPVLQELPPRDTDNQQRDLPGLLDELLDQVEQQRIGLVQVLEDEHDRAVAREPGEHREHALTNLGELIPAVVIAVVVQPERQPQPARRRLDVVGVDPLGHGGSQLLLDVRRRGLAVVAKLTVEHLGDRPELDVLLERTRASGQHLRALGQPGEELGHHPGLPDPRLPEQGDEVRTLARRGPVEHIVQQRQLARAGRRMRSGAGRRSVAAGRARATR